ncbi:MAG: Smr/MutS family protein [Dehalococcoidales bacterium]|jgi:DNA mismatch repair protein MutS2
MKKGRDFSRSDYPAAELDLHARTVEEAIPLVEEFLHDAYARGWQRVRIIHGKGTGTLRLEVDRYLSRNSLVARHSPADRFHGGSGATEVELSRR